jgi:hypothetical protein
VRRSHSACFGWALACLLFASAERGAVAETTVAITGIGTRVGTINTRVERVTYGDPEPVPVEGLNEVLEVRGTVAGIGWGGGGIIARARDAHYAYQIPFVLRWSSRKSTRDVVLHHHGGGVTLLAAVAREKLDGQNNVNRITERAGDEAVGRPALLNRCAYIATNRRGLRGDGSFSATYLPEEVAPLTQAEVDGLLATIGNLPGPAGFTQPGIAVGSPVPLNPSNDVPTSRDIARALQELAARLLRTKFKARIYSGHSSGARLGGAINFGRSAFGLQSLPTGGNQVVPYDLSSERIFDAFLLFGFVYDSDAERADSAQPISAPTFFLQSRGDERYQHPIRMAHELLQKGVDLNRWVRIYEVKGLTHIPRDILFDVPQPATGDAWGGYLGAALTNLLELDQNRREPPLSRIAGRVVGGALVFDQEGGTTTSLVPILENSLLDSLASDPLVLPRLIGPADRDRWLAVTSALAHVDDAIPSPAVACRVGGYGLRFSAPFLTPFSPATLAGLYGDFPGYVACVEDVVEMLEAQRLYDPRVEPAEATAELSRGLFTP